MVQSEWDGIIPALLEGKCDAIIASMSITEERMQRIDFSGKYYNSPGRFVAKEGASLTDTAEGLAGKIVGLQRGTTYNDYMDGEMPDVELKLYGTQDEVYLDLTAGRIDAAFADSIAISDGFLATDAGKGFALFGKDYTDEKYFGVGAGIGVRKGEEALRDGFTAAIKAIRDSGEYKTINDKYFPVDIYGG
jgi:ABC-type amino acid transport substrate-binding protein